MATTRTTETPPKAPTKAPAKAPTRAPARPQGRIGQAIAQVRHGFAETVSELRKVSWPDSDMTRNLTLVVIGISVAVGVLLGVADSLLTLLYQLLEHIGT